MIDDKKIEEAALAYEKKTQVECEKLNKKLGGNEFSVTYKSADAAFKDGAHWAINELLKDLWHPPSEEPVEDKPFLSQEVGRWRVGVNSPLIPNNEWSTQRKIRGIKRWLYVEDLLPKEGGEQ